MEIRVFRAEKSYFSNDSNKIANNHECSDKFGANYRCSMLNGLNFGNIEEIFSRLAEFIV